MPTISITKTMGHLLPDVTYNHYINNLDLLQRKQLHRFWDKKSPAAVPFPVERGLFPYNLKLFLCPLLKGSSITTPLPLYHLFFPYVMDLYISLTLI